MKLSIIIPVVIFIWFSLWEALEFKPVKIEKPWSREFIGKEHFLSDLFYIKKIKILLILKTQFIPNWYKLYH